MFYATNKKFIFLNIYLSFQKGFLNIEASAANAIEWLKIAPIVR